MRVLLFPVFYVYNLVVALDILVNVALGGSPYETVSSRTARNAHVLGWHILGRLITFFDPDHFEMNLLDPREYDVASRVRRFLEER